jgi:hypothetical protein
MLVFDLASGSEVQAVESPDVCGVAAAGAGFACSTGAGLFLRHAGGGADAPVRFADLAFDNHLVRI